MKDTGVIYGNTNPIRANLYDSVIQNRYVYLVHGCNRPRRATIQAAVCMRSQGLSAVRHQATATAYGG